MNLALLLRTMGERNGAGGRAGNISSMNNLRAYEHPPALDGRVQRVRPGSSRRARSMWVLTSGCFDDISKDSSHCLNPVQKVGREEIQGPTIDFRWAEGLPLPYARPKHAYNFPALGSGLSGCPLCTSPGGCCKLNSVFMLKLPWQWAFPPQLIMGTDCSPFFPRYKN